MNVNDSFDKQKIERVKELLELPSYDRTEKHLLELMSFTKVNINNPEFQTFRNDFNDKRTQACLQGHDFSSFQAK